MQIADHRQGMPMWYYHFTFEQAGYRSAIFKIEIKRSAFNRCDWNGTAFLAAAHLLMLDDRKRINPHLRVYWRLSNLSLCHPQARTIDDQTIKVFEKYNERSKKYFFFVIIAINGSFFHWHSCLCCFFCVRNYLKNTYPRYMHTRIILLRHLSGAWDVNPTIQGILERDILHFRFTLCCKLMKSRWTLFVFTLDCCQKSMVSDKTAEVWSLEKCS